MNKPEKKPEMRPRELKDGSGWYVLVQWGDRPSEQVGNRYEDSGTVYPAGILVVPAYGATIRDRGAGSTKCGQAVLYDEPRVRVSSWPPFRLARLRRERESVVVVSPHAPVLCNEGDGS